MSKAFTREDDGADEDGADETQDAALPSSVKNYITPPGAARLKGELHQLLTVERPDLVKVVQWAASNGDRSENGDYLYGKRRLREIDRRIRFLTRRLQAAEIIDPASQKSDRVLFGATVGIRNEEGDERTYRIVGIDETDVKAGKISWISPLGKALLNASEGDAVTLRTPKGEEELEVISVRYQAFE